MGGDQIPKAKGPNNEDQLLQDASTLLMFANTAAKQQEVKKSPSPPVLGMKTGRYSYQSSSVTAPAAYPGFTSTCSASSASSACSACSTQSV